MNCIVCRLYLNKAALKKSQVCLLNILGIEDALIVYSQGQHGKRKKKKNYRESLIQNLSATQETFKVDKSQVIGAKEHGAV